MIEISFIGRWLLTELPAAMSEDFCPFPVPGLNIIFKNGEGWIGDSNQSVNIENVIVDTDYELTTSKSGKATVTEIK